MPGIDTLRYQPGAGIDGPVMRHLTAALVPSFEKPEQADKLFVDYVTMAVAIHVANTYGGMKPPFYPLRGGLAPWQERRVKEVIDENLDGELSLAELAKECELSTRHFTRAFRQTMGTPPHRWLLERRVDKAKALLRHCKLSLSDVALACGFSDQSHFTRIFTHIRRAEPRVLAPAKSTVVKVAQIAL